MYRAGERTLWRDEIWQYNIVGSADLMFDTMRLETMNGLVHVVTMFGWTAVVDRNEFLLRLPSMLAMGVAIGFMAAIAQRWSTATALTAVGLALANPLVWRYGAEARPYAFFTAAGAAALWALLRIHAGDEVRWPVAALAIANVVMIYSHLYGWFYLAAQAAALPLFAPTRRRPLVQAGLLSAFAGAAVPVVMVLSRTEPYAWQQEPSVRTAYRTALELWGQSRPGLAVTVALATIALAGSTRVGRSDGAPAVAVVAVWAAVPPALGWTFSQVKPVWHVRYLLPSLPATLVLAAIGIVVLARFASPLARPVAVALAAVLIVVGVGAVSDLMNFRGFEDLRSPAELVGDEAVAGDRLVYTGGASLGYAHYAVDHPSAATDVEDSYWWYGAVDADRVRAALPGSAAANTYWLVSLIDGDQAWQWHHTVIAALEPTHRVDRSWTFPNVEVRHLVPRSPTS